jgi:hypothetical protein
VARAAHCKGRREVLSWPRAWGECLAATSSIATGGLEVRLQPAAWRLFLYFALRADGGDGSRAKRFYVAGSVAPTLRVVEGMTGCCGGCVGR